MRSLWSVRNNSKYRFNTRMFADHDFAYRTDQLTALSIKNLYFAPFGKQEKPFLLLCLTTSDFKIYLTNFNIM